MNMPHSEHGGTDEGPEPLHDFSTNANPLGACPHIVAAVRSADLTRYPDPHYTALREKLGGHHGCGAQRIVIGAGASELILRLVRASEGPVHVLGPSFSEYERCARMEGRRFCLSRTPEEFLEKRAASPGLGFVCWPNNPTGDLWPLGFLAEASKTQGLVLDLAYAPLCETGLETEAIAAAPSAIHLQAPNKAFGCCGLRAAYLVLPHADERIRQLAPSWVIDRHAEHFLAASVDPESRRWLESCRPEIAALRRRLAASLRSLGYPVRESPATFLLAQVGNAKRLGKMLRTAGIRVRDASSFGLPDCLRLSAQPEGAQQALLTVLRNLQFTREESDE